MRRLDTIRPYNCGYTLIELLTVVAIISILAVIAVPHYSNLKTRSLISTSKAQLRSLADAIETFQIDKGRYPASRYYDSKLDLAALANNGEYISSVDIDDPFQRPAPQDSLEGSSDFSSGAAQSSQSDSGYVYINYRDFLGNQLPTHDGVALYSIGPDHRDSLLSLFPLPKETQNSIRRNLIPVYGSYALQSVMIYSPSNGIYSDGDYGLFRGKFDGFIPKDFF
jgi:prepilin-type N-terminal cleavage/methylation domain-containing protein